MFHIYRSLLLKLTSVSAIGITALSMAHCLYSTSIIIRENALRLKTNLQMSIWVWLVGLSQTPAPRSTFVYLVSRSPANSAVSQADAHTVSAIFNKASVSLSFFDYFRSFIRQPILRFNFEKINI